MNAKHAVATITLFVLSLGGCKYLRKDPGRLVVRASSDDLEAHKLTGTTDTVFTGAADAIAYPAGALVIDKSGAFSRVEPGRTGSTSCTPSPHSTLLAIDDAGNHVLMQIDEAATKTQTVEFMDLTTCASTRLHVRYAYRGDVARDGTEAVVGAFPDSCTSNDLNTCPVTLYRLRNSGSPVPTEILRGGPRAHYQPRYFPDGRIVFQTTERDTTCDGTVNRCRHDIVAMPIAGGPGSTLDVIREGAIAAGVSSDGKRIAYLAYYKEPGCKSALPCKSMSVKIGDVKAHDDSNDVIIASGTASNIPGHPFSLDGKWIAFSTGPTYEPETCHVDGSECRKFGGGHVVGWMK